jgi:hypothetical protein
VYRTVLEKAQSSGGRIAIDRVAIIDDFDKPSGTDKPKAQTSPL